MVKSFKTSIIILITLAISCKSANRDYSRYLKLKDVWEQKTTLAVEACNDSISVVLAKKTFNLINKYDLRGRVLQKLGYLNLESDANNVYIIEEYDGDPSKYKAYFKFPDQKVVYVFIFNENNDELYIKAFGEEDEYYQYYIVKFEPWDNFKDFVTEEQKIFICDNQNLQGSTSFRLNLKL
ncbi:hypothetical protein C9994_12855 [Marivirga lumbricoides]|uniref:Lipoprotein n=1 Tax=Marivirga lumbricoides TaxID=1046115 RepID=A0A2T4DIL0_9BACT|nr:hypothetical protein C9994_12855 [Marivirga lumbricoides]